MDCGENEVDCGGNEVDYGENEVDSGENEVDCGENEVDCGENEMDCGDKPLLHSDYLIRRKREDGVSDRNLEGYKTGGGQVKFTPTKKGRGRKMFSDSFNMGARGNF